MTWFTTWPANGQPQYAPHVNEQAAQKHAEELVKSGKAKVATYFEANQLEESA